MSIRPQDVPAGFRPVPEYRCICHRHTHKYSTHTDTCVNTRACSCPQPKLERS